MYRSMAQLDYHRGFNVNMGTAMTTILLTVTTLCVVLIIIVLLMR